jgi:two-component system sensor histidine kinase RpfC
MTPIATARDWWQHLAPDGEQQMVVNRLLVGLLALLFNGYAAQRGLVSGLPLIAPCLYMALGLLVLLHLLWHRGPSVGRRAIALMLDCAAASYELHIGGAATVWQFSGYLWIIFGNGFRFGPRFLAYSMLVSMIGFGLMVAVTPYWRDNPAQIVGGLIGLAIVPLYALSLINRLSLARRQAEEASRAKSLFLASVSHELRTPLNSIIGIGAMLERTDLEPEQWQMSRTIMTAARSLLSLIDGVLDLSKAESGRTTTTSGDFNLAQLLQEVRSIFAAQARLKGLDINLHVTARTPLLLHGDARILHEILMNLVGNGMKFTEAGSITVTVDATEQQDDRLRLRFAVTDTGIGIAPDAQKRIFEVFTQADNTIVNRFGGTGLGLAIARKSVQLLGGEIGVESVPNQGSVFWFALPLRMQARLPAITPPLHALVLARRTGAVAPLLRRLTDSGVTIEALDAPPPGWPVSVDPSSVCLLAFRAAGAQAPRGGFGPFIFIDVCEHVTTGLPSIKAQRNFASTLYLPVADDVLSHVLQLADILVGQDASTAEDAQPAIAKERFALLVADDNATNRYVMETILSSAGHVVTLASNGEQALDLLAARHFDAAVLDLNMPVMGGIEAAKMYRMITDTDAIIPLIALTADATTATRDSCLAAGMAACLVKPIEPQKLLEMIDEIVVKARDGQLPQAVASADSRVVAIAAHPRFRGNLVSPVNLDVLTRLHKLGGTAFLFEVCTLFRDEAHATMLELDSAAKLGDVSRFRTNAHALRSVAANVGAQYLCDICRPFQSASASELLQNAKSWLALIAEELARVDDALTHYCDSPSSQSQR